MTGPCPDQQALEQLLLGKAPNLQAEALGQHVRGCTRCAQTLRALKAKSTFLAPPPESRPPGGGAEDVAGRLREMPTLLSGPETTAAASDQRDPTWQPGVAGRFDGLRPPEGPGEVGRLGPYRIRKVLGSGGMGVVFAAEDVRLRRPVALKVMKGTLAADPDCRERFLREARAAAALSHDNIISVYHVDEDNGIPFLAMPLLQGETLQSRLAREGRLPPEEVLRIGREVAAGLAAAHEQGLIHRDIKPANIWLEAGTGRAKILDFGLARTMQGGVQMTKTGQIIGTPSYMAPEQARGQAVDVRSDLYSLGVVLYALCTGRLPFPHTDVYALLAALVTETPPPVQSLNPKVPPPLADLVTRLLGKQPENRPPSAQAVVEVIQAIEAGRWVPPPRRRRLAPVAVGAGAAALLGMVGLFIGPVMYRLVTSGDKPLSTAHAPDVQAKAPSEDQDSAPRQDLAGVGKPDDKPRNDDPVVGELRNFVGHEKVVSCVAFLGDGRRVVSGSWDQTVRVWDLNSGAQLARLDGNSGTVRAVAVSRDDIYVATGGFDRTLRL